MRALKRATASSASFDASNSARRSLADLSSSLIDSWDRQNAIIKQEFVKSASDPVYFMKKYCWIQHPTRGRTQFNLYPFQEKVLGLLNKHDKSVILKSRQLGISTLSAGIALHMMLFQKDKNILVIATKQETAKNLVTKVRFMYDQLPSWLK